MKRALDLGWAHDEIHRMTGIDPWFLEQIQQIVDLEKEIEADVGAGRPLTTRSLREAKRMGFSDVRIAQLTRRHRGRSAARAARPTGIVPVYKRVDTCAAEFESYTPYLYSTYERECEAEPTDRRKIVILGSGPNRIGQGIEFDYCCCHAAFAFREEGYETIMVNCNPETVSTDYDTSDRLYFEPLTFEDVMNIIEVEKPEGVVIQFGGQTPLKLALPLPACGRQDPGHEPRRHRPRRGPQALQRAPHRSSESRSPRAARPAPSRRPRWSRERIGYPVLVRPSYVLGGRAMAIVYDETRLEEYAREAVEASPEHPVLVDRFLEDAFEVDVDAVADGERVVIGGIMQHIEEAGIHSGDSAAVLPSYKIAPAPPRDDPGVHAKPGPRPGRARPHERAVRDQGRRRLRPRGQPARLAHHALRQQGHRRAPGQGRRPGHRRDEASPTQGITEDLTVPRIFIKESVFPFLKFPGHRHPPGPGDEVHRRGDGRLRGLRPRLREVPGCGRLHDPDVGRRSS